MRFWFARRRKACTVVAVLIVAVSQLLVAYSAPPTSEPEGTLTLADAVSSTLRRNPDLAVAAFALKAGDARTLQAGLHPNPEASLEVGGLLGTGVARDADEKQATLTLSQVLELGGKRDRRVEVAQSERAALEVEQRTRELDVLVEVTRRFIEVVADQEQINSSRGALQLAERTEKAIAARVQAARTPQAALSRARIATTRARIALRQTQSVLEGARRNLAAMWGGMVVRFVFVWAVFFVLFFLVFFVVLCLLLVCFL